MAIDFEEPLFQQTDALPNIKEGAAGRLMLFTQAPGAAKPPGRYGLFAANVEPFYEACHAQLHFKSFIPPPDVRAQATSHGCTHTRTVPSHMHIHAHSVTAPHTLCMHSAHYNALHSLTPLAVLCYLAGKRLRGPILRPSGLQPQPQTADRIHTREDAGEPCSAAVGGWSHRRQG